MGLFPRLTEYAGSGTYLSNFVPGSRLRSANFSINDNTDINSAIKALSGSTARIENINITSYRLDRRVFELLAVHAPDVTTLLYGALHQDGGDEVHGAT
jgi:hypothetical protein